MATRTEIFYECDMPAGKHDGEVETRTFTLDGTSREIDLCARHNDAFGKAMSSYVTASRKSALAKVTPLRTRTRVSREQVATVRKWAKDNGHAISERGRIPAAIFRQYEAAAH